MPYISKFVFNSRFFLGRGLGAYEDLAIHTHTDSYE